MGIMRTVHHAVCHQQHVFEGICCLLLATTISTRTVSIFVACIVCPAVKWTYCSLHGSGYGLKYMDQSIYNSHFTHLFYDEAANSFSLS